MAEILVYIFSLGAFLSGLLVISSKNPVNSVLGLVLCFANSSILLLMLGFEFLALLFLIVYVGALAILFLFVVMMLNIRLVELIENSTRYIPIGSIIGIIFILELLVIVDEQYTMSPRSAATNLWWNTQNNPYIINNSDISLNIWNNSSLHESYQRDILNFTNIENIGNLLYTYGYWYFIISSIVLLIAMIGAIVLTLYHEQEVRRQDIFSQITTEIKLNNLNIIKSGTTNKPDFRLRN